MTAPKPRTPLTETKVVLCSGSIPWEAVPADFARRLEQDRARLIGALKEAKTELAKASELNSTYFEADALLRELGELE